MRAAVVIAFLMTGCASTPPQQAVKDERHRQPSAVVAPPGDPK